MFTQYIFTPAQVADWAQESAAGLATSRPGVNPAQFAARVIAERLQAKPALYVEYGPYWWAVKRALSRLGYDFGRDDDAVIRATYAGQMADYFALVAGERFKAFYRSNFLAGAREFILDDGESGYMLGDTDMDLRAMGLPPDLTTPEQSDGLVLDSASDAAPEVAERPFRLQFVMDGALWTADMMAADQPAAEAKLSELEGSGRLAEAVDFAKGIGPEPVLDSADYDRPLWVDITSRRVCELGAVL